MARIRTIKPSFFESEDVAVLPLRARLLWIGLWTHCDDEGRTKDNGKLIKARIWPLDPFTLKDIEEDLATLAGHGRIVRYEVDGQRYLEITNWREHQSINKPTASKIPSPPKVPDNSRRTTGTPPEDSRQEGKGKEGKGKEGKGGDARGRETEHSPTEQPGPHPPPPKCDQHIHDPNPPNCGRCADARRQHETWKTNRPAPNRIDPRPDYDEIAATAASGQQRSQLAAAASAQIRRPAPSKTRADPVAAARERGTSLDALEALTAGLPPLTQPPPPDEPEPLAEVYQLHPPRELS